MTEVPTEQPVRDSSLDAPVYRKPRNTGRCLNFHYYHFSTANQGFIKGRFLRVNQNMIYAWRKIAPALKWICFRRDCRFSKRIMVTNAGIFAHRVSQCVLRFEEEIFVGRLCSHLRGPWTIWISMWLQTSLAGWRINYQQLLARGRDLAKSGPHPVKRCVTIENDVFFRNEVYQSMILL